MGFHYGILITKILFLVAEITSICLIGYAKEKSMKSLNYNLICASIFLGITVLLLSFLIIRNIFKLKPTSIVFTILWVNGVIGAIIWLIALGIVSSKTHKYRNFLEGHSGTGRLLRLMSDSEKKNHQRIIPEISVDDIGVSKDTKYILARNLEHSSLQRALALNCDSKKEACFIMTKQGNKQQGCIQFEDMCNLKQEHNFWEIYHYFASVTKKKFPTTYNKDTNIDTDEESGLPKYFTTPLKSDHPSFTLKQYMNDSGSISLDNAVNCEDCKDVCGSKAKKCIKANATAGQSTFSTTGVCKLDLGVKQATLCDKPSGLFYNCENSCSKKKLIASIVPHTFECEVNGKRRSDCKINFVNACLRNCFSNFIKKINDLEKYKIFKGKEFCLTRPYTNEERKDENNIRVTFKSDILTEIILFNDKKINEFYTNSDLKNRFEEYHITFGEVCSTTNGENLHLAIYGPGAYNGEINVDALISASVFAGVLLATYLASIISLIGCNLPRELMKIAEFTRNNAMPNTNRIRAPEEERSRRPYSKQTKYENSSRDRPNHRNEEKHHDRHNHRSNSAQNERKQREERGRSKTEDWLNNEPHENKDPKRYDDDMARRGHDNRNMSYDFDGDQNHEYVRANRTNKHKKGTGNSRDNYREEVNNHDDGDYNERNEERYELNPKNMEYVVNELNNSRYSNKKNTSLEKNSPQKRRSLNKNTSLEVNTIRRDKSPDKRSQNKIRDASPNRNYSPDRNYSPSRNVSPNRNVSPSRNTTLNRNNEHWDDKKEYF